MEGNSITEVPDWIACLQALEGLFLGTRGAYHGNKITRLPPAMARLAHLRRLDLRGNPIENPKADVYKGMPWLSKGCARA